MAHDREVAGIRCSDVLAALSDYLEQSVSPEQKQKIEDHLKGCDWCESFGGDFAAALQKLKDNLHQPEELDKSIAARLIERLNRET